MTSGLPHPHQLCQPAVVKLAVVAMSADLCFYLGLHGGGRILQHPAPVVSSSVCFLSLLFRMQPAVPAASWGRGPGDGLHASYLIVVGRSFHTPSCQASQRPGWLTAPTPHHPSFWAPPHCHSSASPLCQASAGAVLGPRCSAPLTPSFLVHLLLFL